MPYPFLYIVVAVVAALAAYALWRQHKYPYYARGRLLTEGELRFYPTLKAALPDGLQIMMKVRLADIITCADHHWQAGWGRYIAGKHIDFVLIDPDTTDVKLCIELDDSTHVTMSERRTRDDFVNRALAKAGVPLVRVVVGNGRYDTRWLSNQITTALNFQAEKK